MALDLDARGFVALLRGVVKCVMGQMNEYQVAHELFATTDYQSNYFGGKNLLSHIYIFFFSH